MQHFVSQQDALTLLALKLATYQRFNATYPGFAGFLPWVGVNSGVVSPTPDWEDRVPSLDNGEWVWGLYAVVQALDGCRCAPRLAGARPPARLRALFSVPPP